MNHLKKVSYAHKAETQPLETDLQTLELHARRFEQRSQALGAELADAEQQAATAMLDDDEAKLSSVTRRITELKQERETLVDAAKLAQVKLAERRDSLTAVHTAAERREANRRWQEVAKAAEGLDKALTEIELAASRFQTAMKNTRMLAPHHASPPTVSMLLRRVLWADAPHLIELVSPPPHARIDKAIAGTGARIDLTRLFADEPAKRPYPTQE